MTYVYSPRGVCSYRIEVEINGDVIENVRFFGGCSGNTQGVAALVRGMRVQDAAARLAGIRCGARPTSCPDQLAKALLEALKNAN